MRTTLTLMLTILATFCQGECPIECYCDRVTTCTGDKLLTRFPKIYTSSFSISNSFGDSSSSSSEPVMAYPTRLELHEYGVSYLSRKDFLQIISNLTELSLTRNSLEEIDNETFSLSSSTSSPSGPSTSTTSTEGEEQHFFSAHPSSSKSADSLLFKLRILDLSQNKLNHFVGGGRLKRLRILDLSSNKLQQVYELSGIQSLESVNLRDNLISYLEPTIFQNLRYLQYVNLDSNAIGSIHPSTFSNLPALGHLILSSNPISNLLPGFYWNSRVQFVDVSHVGLTSIPTSLTHSVRDFRCANNNLTIIRQTDFESYPNVGLLVLDENAIETVEDDAFGRLDFLSRLWMNGNRLSKTPQNLPPSLQSLHLEDNRIANLSSTDFKNLRNLGELNLHGNRINSLPPYVFAELTSLKNLDLRSNVIDVIYRDSFANLSKLQTLDVSQNPIKVIVSGAFGNLQLSLLHLSRLMEPIEFDATSFSLSLEKLQILELDDSPHFAQKLIQDSALSHVSNLIELNLQRCELQDLNLVSNLLSELNLQVVKMSGNPWDCQEIYGSGIHELMSRRTVVDNPVCDQPSSLKGHKLSSLNFSLLSQTTQSSLYLEENSSDENLLDFTELTPEPEDQNYSSSSSTSDGGGSTSSANTTTNITSFSSLHSSSISLDKVTNASNTNFPENAPHASDANANTTSTTNTTATSPASLGGGGPPGNNQNGPSQTQRRTKNLSTSSRNTLSNPTSPSNSSKLTNVKATVVPIISSSSYDQSSSPTPSDDSKGLEDTAPASTMIIPRSKNTSDINKSGKSSSVQVVDSMDTDTVPTRSYFDYSWKPLNKAVVEKTGKTSIGSSSDSDGKIGVGGSSSSRSGGNKKPAISILIGRPRTESLDKTKTNDDNTIIDESGRTGSSGRYSSKRRPPDDEEETGPKSIGWVDGFPSGYSHSDADRLLNESPTSNNAGTTSTKRRNKIKPEAFYLKRESPSNTPSYESTSGAIIVKTLIISATACLGSIFILLSVSYGVYRFTQRKSNIFYCSSSSSSGRKSGEDNGTGDTTGCTRMSYTRFGRRERQGRTSRRNPSNSKDHCHNQTQLQEEGDSDSDQVELSGISNRLYLENNDEIYHIT